LADDQQPMIAIVPQGEDQEPSGGSVEHPAKLLRIASMIRELVEEVRHTGLDEGGRQRLGTIYHRSVEELKETLSDDLQEELEGLMAPLEGSPTESEVRVAQAQLLGWLEGLFHGIQAALWSQQMQARAALEQMRRRSLPAGKHGDHGGQEPGPEGTTPGQYL
jgi:hypothetical protein